MTTLSLGTGQADTGQRAAQVGSVALWHLRLLGGFELDDGQQVLTRLASRHAVQLLMRLALAPGRQHAREELIELLWPDAEASAGRNRLRQTLFNLKAVLEPPGSGSVVLADRRAVWLQPDTLWCDVPAFERALRERRHDDARALYRGELLPGLYDEWIHEERQRLQALADRLMDAPAVPGPPAAPRSPSATARTAEPAPHPPSGLTATGNPLPRPSPALRLPHYLTRLIGADQAGTRLRELVRQQPLVTVLGAGGSGKTRLAVEVARHLLREGDAASPADFERVLFISLVGCIQASSLLDALVVTLQLGGAGEPFEKLRAALDGQRLLLLLDNAEQLDDAAVALLARLADALPQAHWLVTSRRPLGLDGEQRFILEPLAPPAADAPQDEVALNAAIALFVDRARAHRPDFHVHPANRDSLVALVHWLGGLPLAIELAASRSRSLSPGGMLALLEGTTRGPDDEAGPRLSWLARRGPRNGRDARQASMLTVLQWSWDLLTPAQQSMLRAVSMFPAGASRRAAGLVFDALHPPPAEHPRTGSAAAQVQALLDDLLDHSLVHHRAQALHGAETATASAGEGRYGLNPPVREFVVLKTLSEEACRLRAGMLSWAAGWAAALPATPPLEEVRQELPNLLASLASALADGLGQQALSLVLSLQPAWAEIALPGSALDMLDQMLALPALPPDLAAQGHALAAWSSHDAGRRDAASRHADSALALLPSVSDETLGAQVLHRVARMRWRIQRDSEAARELLRRALPVAQQHHMDGLHGALLSLEAHLAVAVDQDSARAHALSRQALALCRRTGNAHVVNAHRFNAAMGLILAGEPAQALPELQLLATEGRALHDWDLAAGALDATGTALLALRRWDEAAQAHRESLAIAWQAMDALAIVYALWNIAPALARLRRPRLAAWAMGHAAQAWPRHFGELDESDLRDLRRVRRFVRTLLQQAEAEAAWEAGRTAGLAEVVAAVLRAD